MMTPIQIDLLPRRSSARLGWCFGFSWLLKNIGLNPLPSLEHKSKEGEKNAKHYLYPRQYLNRLDLKLIRVPICLFRSFHSCHWNTSYSVRCWCPLSLGKFPVLVQSVVRHLRLPPICLCHRALSHQQTLLSARQPHRTEGRQWPVEHKNSLWQRRTKERGQLYK